MTLQAKWVPHGGPEYEAIVALRREVLRKPLGLDFTAEQLASEAAELFLGLWEGKRLLGCLLLRDDGGGNVRMRQVAVAASAQGRGIGRLLVLESETEARRRGFKRMVLHARQTAVAFYQKLGYAAEGETFEEVGLPHRFMRKDF
jgi:ribosomal protein S18 acetylase RimI-like enzyme